VRGPWHQGVFFDLPIFFVLISYIIYAIDKYIYIYQSPCFKVVPRAPQDLRRRTEITPVKDSHTRILLFILTNDHGRYITVTLERKLMFVRDWPLHIAVINL
jgi:hypothetical protein